MKKSFFLQAPIGVLSVLILFFAGCKSAPPPPEPTIWERLLTRDASAKDFFLGEVDVNETDDDGRTPLHYAAELKDAQLAAFFISIGANPNALDHSGQSALGICIENVDTATSRILAAAGADIHLTILENKTAASYALSRGPAVFKSILTPSNIPAADSSGKTVLHMAVIAGSVMSVNDIIEISSSASLVNKYDKTNKNPLDYALERPDSVDHIKIAEQLVLLGGYSENPVFDYFGPAARSANFNTRRSEGLAPIHYAVINNYSGLINFLLDKKIDVNIKSTSGATALHEAVRVGNIDVITRIINSGANVNSRDGNNNTPLHTGSPAESHREVVTLLLNSGADPNLRDDHGDTPLHIVITLNRQLDVIEAFLNKNSDVHIRNIQGKTPLYIAVQENRMSLIPALLKNGSEIFAADNSGVTPFDIAVKENESIFNLLIVPETVNQRDSAGNTMLHAAVRNRANPLQIARILDTRALVDARNRDGDTALHIAVRMNQKESGEFLISRGALIFSLNAAGHSPLFLALTSEPIRDWIINPATIVLKDGLGNNMLHYAAEWNLTNAIPIIIKNGLSVDETNDRGETALFMSIKNNSPSAISVFLENNANINVRDTQGNSGLHTAIRWSAENAAQILIAQKIDLNAQSLNGNTPLHDAVILKAADIENQLITNGANLEIRNLDGNSPLMEAVKSSNGTSVQKLALNKADLNTRNTRGDTPLHIAVSMKDINMVNLLLRVGSSIHARNTSERTPFQLSLHISAEMVSALLTPDRINQSDDMGNSSLHIALQEKAPNNIISAIIAKGTRINTVDNNGKTPLRLAVDMEQWEAAKIIADAGADPFLMAADNKNPAVLSFVKGQVCLRSLFSGRMVNSKDSLGNTILHLAAQQGTPETIATLIELGANKTIRNIALELPYDIAVRWNRSNNAELLR